MSSTATKGHATHHTEPGEVHPHIAPWQFLTVVFIILLGLTALTVYTAREVHLGDTGNIILALAIAALKSALVVGFFMHLHWDNKFNAVVLLFTMLAIFTFIIFTIIDLGSRGVVDPVRAEMVAPDTVEKAREAAAAEHGADSHEGDAPREEPGGDHGGGH